VAEIFWKDISDKIKRRKNFFIYIVKGIEYIKKPLHSKEENGFFT